jgi:DNA polymerase-3 subunit beta
MKFTITKKEMMSALNKVSGIVDNKGTIPILGNILLKTVGADKLTICATDMEVSASITATSENEIEGGVTIPFKSLSGIVSSVTNDIEITAKGHRVTIASGHGKFTLGTLPVEDYPGLPNPSDEKEFEISGKELLKKINEIGQSMVPDDVRPYAACMCIDSDGNGMKFITTDGNRLSIAVSDVKTHKFVALIPAKTTLMLPKVFSESEKIKVSVTENLVKLSAENITLITKLVSYTYPDMMQFVAPEWSNSYTVDSSELRETLKRVSLAQKGHTSRVMFELADGELRLSCNDAENEFSDRLEAAHECEPLKRCFNANYVLSILDKIDGPVLVQCNDKPDSVNLMTSGNKHSDTLWLVMGMKF